MASGDAGLSAMLNRQSGVTTNSLGSVLFYNFFSSRGCSCVFLQAHMKVLPLRVYSLDVDLAE